MKKFESLEEAQAGYDELAAAYESQGKELKTITQQLEDATNVVTELNAKLEEEKKNAPGDVFATVGKAKYRVNFGVRGKKKAEVAADAKLMAELVKIGSGALTAVK